MTKRISNDKNYIRPNKTYQDTLSNQEIREKLKEYKKVENIKTVSIGTHIRYFTINPKTKEHIFRLGGNLNKIDPEGRFVILSNGTVNWSVQIPNTLFYQKMTENEFKEEIKKELKKELMTEIGTPFTSDKNIISHNSDENIIDLKKEIKNLNKKLESYKDMEKELKNLVKKNDILKSQLSKIENEVKKTKTKK